MFPSVGGLRSTRITLPHGTRRLPA